jgi:hypothetical protein
MRAGGERERSDWLASLESRVMIGQRAPSRADSAATQVTNEGGRPSFFSLLNMRAQMNVTTSRQYYLKIKQSINIL